MLYDLLEVVLNTRMHELVGLGEEIQHLDKCGHQLETLLVSALIKQLVSLAAFKLLIHKFHKSSASSPDPSQCYFRYLF